MWLAQNWWVVWGLSCGAILIVAYLRYRETPLVQAVTRAWARLTLVLVGLVGVAFLLMLVGVFTEEWTCKCAGPEQWECKGTPSCKQEADAHFDTSRHTMTCKRSDWPMRPMVAITEFVFSK